MSKSAMSMMADAITPTKEAPAAAGGKKGGKKNQAANDSQTVAAGDAGTMPAAVTEGQPSADAAAAAPAKAPKPAPVPKDPNVQNTYQELCKALWSSRGNVFLKVDHFPIPVAVVKKEMTEFLRNQNPATPSPYNLVARADNTGSDLIPRVAPAEEPKADEGK